MWFAKQASVGWKIRENNRCAICVLRKDYTALCEIFTIQQIYTDDGKSEKVANDPMQIWEHVDRCQSSFLLLGVNIH